MDANALVIIFERNNFYRRQYLLTLAAFVLNVIAIIFLIFVLIALQKHPVRPVYFATDNVGRLVRIIPVSQKNMSTDDLLDWTMQAVQESGSYDFMNYRDQLQGSQKYFTYSGWSKFKTAFSAANNLPSVLQNKMIVLTKIVGIPRIIQEGLLTSGNYGWQIQMPILVTYWSPPYDDTSKFSNALTATVLIEREPVLQSYQGIGILQLVETAPNASPSQPQEISGSPTG